MSPQSGMSAQLSEVRGGDALAVPFARPRVRPEKALRYELNVVAADVTDVVSGIGGWLFDRAMAGWRVSVASGEGGDERALRILGLNPVGPDGLCRSAEADSVAMAAIGTSPLESGDRGLTLRDLVGDVVFFGAPEGLGVQVQRLRYLPSAAALAFKSHAMAMVGGDPASAGGVETLFRCGRSAGLLDADLVPVC